tara:strand:+ start:389 stop:592 length:204 start_codon:yes stop_codon:yes gene_type:complete
MAIRYEGFFASPNYFVEVSSVPQHLSVVSCLVAHPPNKVIKINVTIIKAILYAANFALLLYDSGVFP